MLSRFSPSTRVRLLSISWLAITTAGAQSSGGSLKFSCASWDRIDGPPVYYLSGKPKPDESIEARLKRLEPVDIPEMTRSLVYEFKGGRDIGFYRKARSADGTPSLQHFASVTVPADWDRVLLVFFPTGEHGVYRIYMFRDDRKHAPYGSYQFVNLTEQPLQGFLDRQSISLGPNGRSIVKLRGEQPRPLNFGFWTTVDGQKKWLQRNTLTYRPNKYLIYFFYALEDGMGRLKVRSKGIVDFRPPPVEEEEGVPAPEDDDGSDS